MDRDLLDAAVALLDGLTSGAAGPPGRWWELWRLVGAGGPEPATVAGCAEAVERALGRPDRRLAVYGTLRPGEPNHHLLADLTGSWRPATVRGEVGAWRGYPILRPSPAGPAVPAMVLASPGLPARLDRLDEFEGPAYRRAWVVADLAPAGPEPAAVVVARCYVDVTWRGTGAVPPTG